MKRVLTLLIIILSFVNMNAQDKLGISVATYFGGYQAPDHTIDRFFSPELSIQAPIYRSIKAVARVSSNFKDANRFNLGLGYTIGLGNRLGLDIGAEYSHRRYDYSRYENVYGDEKFNLNSIEFPLLLNYDLSRNSEIFFGTAMNYNLSSRANYRFLPITNVRLGFTFKL